MTAKTLEELAQLLDAEYVGNPVQEVRQVVHPLQAMGPEDLALILDAAIVSQIPAGALQTALVPSDVEVSTIPNQLKVKRPKVALAKLLDVFERPVTIPPGIHPSSVIDPTAVLGEGVTIGPLCWIGPNTVVGKGTRLVSHVSIGADAVIGEDCLFHAGVAIGDRVQIGSRVIVQSNASIGSDGFSYVTAEAGSVETAKATGEIQSQNTEILRINSIGTVVLEDDVEIGANACVDRATLGETRIRRGSKIDNQVQVAHNVTMGENCLLAAQVGIAGSARIGDRVVMGGQAGIRDHITVGNDVVVVAKSGATSDVPDKTILIGLQGMPRKDFLRREVKYNKLLSVPEQLEALSKRISQLETSHSEEVGQPV